MDDPDSARSILQAGHWDDIVYKATNVEGDLSVSGLLSEIKRLGTSYPALYGNAAPVIKSTLEQLNKVQKQFLKKKQLKLDQAYFSLLKKVISVRTNKLLKIMLTM